MKLIKILLLGTYFLIGICCTEKDIENTDNKLAGTWIEKNPELWDGVSDTIVFTKDFLIEKHFYFDGYGYEQKNDSIVFFKDDVFCTFTFEFISTGEIVIYNFLDRSITAVAKNIHFVKLN